jgi:KAP family P-loop domain
LSFEAADIILRRVGHRVRKSMAGDQNYSVKGDRALSSGDEDKLGFREVAKQIVTSLVDCASQDGLVIGIEGAWGSGKSSLLFLIGDELGKLPEDRRPTVINFRPWLIGNRDALITSLFGELSRELDRVALNAGDPTRISVAKAKEAGEALRSFMNGLGRAGSVIEFAGEASGIGLLKLAGKGAKAAADAAGKEPAPLPLSELKDKLVTSLRDLGHRFVITIDDVDRLEPAEVIEILRLVRSVVDLPNVIYLLCYDSDTLAHSIERAASVSGGHLYLEKIVQLTVMVPKPEPLQLRQWFSDELHLVASTKDEDELSRLKLVIDYEGGRQLRTPRSVVRALDAVRFFWPPLREDCQRFCHVHQAGIAGAAAEIAGVARLRFVRIGTRLRWPAKSFGSDRIPKNGGERCCSGNIGLTNADHPAPVVMTRVAISSTKS